MTFSSNFEEWISQATYSSNSPLMGPFPWTRKLATSLKQSFLW